MWPLFFFLFVTFVVLGEPAGPAKKSNKGKEELDRMLKDEKAVCAKNKCENGGVCILNATASPGTPAYLCLCPTGFSGKHCTDVQTKCSKDLCQNGGLCKNEPHGYKCICKEPYTGSHCLVKKGSKEHQSSIKKETNSTAMQPKKTSPVPKQPPIISASKTKTKNTTSSGVTKKPQTGKQQQRKSRKLQKRKNRKFGRRINKKPRKRTNRKLGKRKNRKLGKRKNRKLGKQRKRGRKGIQNKRLRQLKRMEKRVDKKLETIQKVAAKLTVSKVSRGNVTNGSKTTTTSLSPPHQAVTTQIATTTTPANKKSSPSKTNTTDLFNRVPNGKDKQKTSSTTASGLPDSGSDVTPAPAKHTPEKYKKNHQHSKRMKLLKKYKNVHNLLNASLSLPNGTLNGTNIDTSDDSTNIATIVSAIIAAIITLIACILIARSRAKGKYKQLVESEDRPPRKSRSDEYTSYTESRMSTKDFTSDTGTLGSPHFDNTLESFMLESSLFKTTALGRILQEEQRKLKQKGRDQTRKDYTYVLKVSYHSYEIGRVSSNVYISASRPDSVQKLSSIDVQKLINQSVEKLHSAIQAKGYREDKINPGNIHLTFECNASLRSMGANDIRVYLKMDGSVKLEDGRSLGQLPDESQCSPRRPTHLSDGTNRTSRNSSRHNAASDGIEITCDAGDQSFGSLENFSACSGETDMLVSAQRDGQQNITQHCSKPHSGQPRVQKKIPRSTDDKYPHQPLQHLRKYRPPSLQKYPRSPKASHHQDTAHAYPAHNRHSKSKQNTNTSAKKAGDSYDAVESSNCNKIPRLRHSVTKTTEPKSTQTLAMLAGPYAVNREEKWTDDFNPTRCHINKLHRPVEPGDSQRPRSKSNHRQKLHSQRQRDKQIRPKTFSCSPSQQRIAAAKSSFALVLPTRSHLFVTSTRGTRQTTYQKPLHRQRNDECMSMLCTQSSQTGPRSSRETRDPSVSVRQEIPKTLEPPPLASKPPCVTYSSSEGLLSVNSGHQTLHASRTVMHAQRDRSHDRNSNASDGEWEEGGQQHHLQVSQCNLNRAINRARASHEPGKRFTRSNTGQHTPLRQDALKTRLLHPKCRANPGTNPAEAKWTDGDTNCSMSTDMCVKANTFGDNTATQADTSTITDAGAVLESKMSFRRKQLENSDDDTECSQT